MCCLSYREPNSHGILPAAWYASIVSCYQISNNSTAGRVATELVVKSNLLETDISFVDPPELAASTMMYLCSGQADWLNGRFVDATWDLGQVEGEWKDKIIKNDLLFNKLDVVA